MSPVLGAKPRVPRCNDNEKRTGGNVSVRVTQQHPNTRKEM